MKITILLLFVILFSCQQQREKEIINQKPVISEALEYKEINSSNACETLNGYVYTYLPAPEKTSHSFTLKFDCMQDSLKGIIFGPDPEGEHGLFYYKSELRNLMITDSSIIRFSVIPGKLYEKQITLENYKDEFESSGRTSYEFIYEGRFLADTSIVLRCRAEFYGCYTDEDMTFKLQK